MPVIKSAVKRMRQDTKRRARNRVVKDELRRRTKALAAAVEAKDSKQVEASLNDLYAQLDKAVKKNILHKNTAARRKSQAATLAKSVGGKATAKKTTAKKTATKKPAAKKSTTTKAKTSTTKKTSSTKSATAKKSTDAKKK